LRRPLVQMGCGASPKAKPVEPQPVAPAAAAPSEGPKTPSKESEIPPKKLLAIKAAFQAIDTNKSGSIDTKELSVLVGKVGAALSEKDQQDLLKTMDKDGSTTISFAEFTEWVVHSEGLDDAIANWTTTKGLGEVHNAAIAGDAAKIKSLIEAGGLVNARDVTDVTPLHYAARVGKAEAATALIEMKADVTAVTSDAGRMPLHAAAENGSVEVIKILVAAGAPLDAKDVRERTPLHWACCSSREEAAIELINCGADLNVKSAAGYTPYAMAQDWSTMQLADLIESKGGAR